jgi:hypothetical protein
MEKKIANRIEISRFSRMDTLLNVTYRVFHALAWKPGYGHFVKYINSLRIVDADQREAALQFWLRHSQKMITPELRAGKYFRLKPALNEKTGIYHLNGRFGNNPNWLPSHHTARLPVC